MSREKRNRIIGYVVLALAGLSLLILNYLLQRSVPFHSDDIWYSRKLGSDYEPLESVGDILTFQKWHYLSWGGRSVTHTILQFILMAGPMAADLLNVLFYILLALLITRITGKVSPKYMLLFGSLIIVLNPNFYDTLFWQAGCVNYLYSTTWILLFASLYMNSLSEDYILPKGSCIFIIPLAVMTGWSNENMGPASFCMAVFTILYLMKSKRKIHPALILGAVFSLAGSAAMLLAPGNFTRKDLITGGIFDKLILHLTEFDRATFLYLGPVLLFSMILYVVYRYIRKKSITPRQLYLMVFAVISHGAMLLSPTYPSRASFGVLAVTLCFDISLLRDMEDEKRSTKLALWILLMAAYVLTMFILVQELRYPTRQSI